MEKKKMMHISIANGDIGGYVLLPGSPERAEMLSHYLDDVHEVAWFREYRTFTGFLDGERVSITSTGMGGPSMAIAVEELHECGAHTVIRVGTCTSTSDHVHACDLVLPNGAVRMEKVAEYYSSPEYPAVPDMDVLAALEEAAVAGKKPHHIGVNISKACFSTQYMGQDRPWGSELRQRWQAYEAGGALSADMSCATLFVAASAEQMRAGAVLAVTTERNQRPVYQCDIPQECETLACDAAVAGLRCLIRADRRRAEEAKA